MASVSLSRTPALSLQQPVGHGTSSARGAVAVAGLVATQHHGPATAAIVAGTALAVATRNRQNEKRSVARRAGKEELTPVKEAVAQCEL